MRHSSVFLSRTLLLASLGVALLGAALRAEEKKHDYEVTDSTQVYLGQGKYPAAPAVIKVNDVYAKIPEYKKIVDENLTTDDPEYLILMKKATERFQKALKKEAKRQSYDLIAEVGAVKANNGKKIPNATKDMIDLVSRD